MANEHRFVWHDLNTKDVEVEKQFYGKLFGWTFEKSDDGRYEHIKAGSEMIGGIHPLEAASSEASRWLGYVSVEDVEQTVKAAASHAGKVHHPPKDMSGVGTFAVIEDPAGGYVAPWKTAHPEDEQERVGDAAPMTFFWDELVTTNAEGEQKFYEDVFGWELDPFGPDYTLFRRQGTKGSNGQTRAAGGVAKITGEAHATFWIPYVYVQDPDAIARRARELGAHIDVPPTDIPQIGRYSVLTDPQGARIAVMKPAPM